MDADAWAGNTLISAEDFNVFKAREDFSRQSVCEFAITQGIAPGIVVGRMQREGMIQYSMLNDLKEHYVIAVNMLSIAGEGHQKFLVLFFYPKSSTLIPRIFREDIYKFCYLGCIKIDGVKWAVFNSVGFVMISLRSMEKNLSSMEKC